jgi:capsular polysaccharide biosynthesis protein
MQLSYYLALLRRRWLVLGAAIVVAVALATMLTPRTSLYQADATIYVGTRTFDLGATSNDISYERTLGLDRLISTFAIMIDSQAVAEQADLAVGRSPATIVAETTVTQIADTQLLRISVRDVDPAVARTIANGLADTFIGAVQQFEPPGATAREGEVPRLPASVFERARLPTTPLPTGLLVNVLLSMVLGAAVGVGVVVLLDYLDTTLRSPADIETKLDLPVLGVIPDFGTQLRPRPRRRPLPPPQEERFA